MGARMKADDINTRDTRSVLIWIVHNPLPSIEEMEVEAAQQVIAEREARIEKHRAAITRLESQTRT
jgi:hypothetical protein